MHVRARGGAARGRRVHGRYAHRLRLWSRNLFKEDMHQEEKLVATKKKKMHNHMSSLQLWPVWHRPKKLHTLPGGVLPKPRWGILMQFLSNGALPKRDWADLVSLVFSWKISRKKQIMELLLLILRLEARQLEQLVLQPYQELVHFN